MSKDNLPSGMVYGLPIDEYHAGTELSKTGLDDLARSPAIYRALREPGAPVREETSSQLHGNLAHCAILEPDAFAKRYSVHPRMNRNTKVWRDIVADAEQDKIKPIQDDQYETAMAQSASVLSLTEVYGKLSMEDLLGEGWAEPSAYWTDRDTGVLCRCRPDWVHPLNKRQAVLLDVKTYGDASARAFRKQVSRMRYHVQDAFYSEGYAAAASVEVVAFIFVVVEDKYPYAAASYSLGEESKWEGLNEVRRLTELYAECQRTGHWPGYSPRTTVIDLPSYELTPQEMEISYAAE